MHKRILLVLAAVCGLLTAGAPVPAAEYTNYVVYPWSWPNPQSLTVCFWEGQDVNRAYSDGTSERSGRLPDEFRGFVKAAANIWSDAPDIPINIAVVDTCTSKTNMVVYGSRDNSQPADARTWGGCIPTADDEDRTFTDQMCAPGSGSITFNLKKPVSSLAPRRWTHMAVKVFGLNLGLYFPLNQPCEDRCYGPVMSSGSCPSAEKCVVNPDPNDKAGIKELYYASGSSGSGCLAVRSSANGGPGIVGRLSTWTDQLDDYVDPSQFEVTVPPVTVPPVTVPPIDIDEVGLSLIAPVQGQVIATSILEDTDLLRAVNDPFGAVGDLVETLAVPEVDAVATLEATAAEGWRSVQMVLDTAGVTSPVPLPAC